MDKFTIIVVVALILVGVFRAADAQCSAAALNNTCMQPFQPWNMAFILGTVVGQSNVTAACSAYNSAVSCAMSIGCPDTDPIVIQQWLGTKQAIGYVCNNQAAYLANQVCFAGPTFINAVLGCGITGINTTQAPSLACQSLFTSISCVGAQSQVTCGPSAATFMSALAPLRLTPPVTLVAPGCTGQCNLTTLQTCLNGFSVWSKGFSLSSIDSSNITAACTSYNSTVACVLNAGCTDTDYQTMTLWTGKKNAVANNCGSGQQAYLAGQPCTSTSAFTNAIGACLQPIASNLAPSAACSTFNSQLQCVATAATKVCGLTVGSNFASGAPGFLGPAFRAQYPTCVITTPSATAGGRSSRWSDMAHNTLMIITAAILASHSL